MSIMKRTRILLVVGGVVLLTMRAQGALTLDEVWTMTLEQNPRIEEMAQRVEAAQAVLRQARSAWYPQVTAQGGYTLMNVDMQPEFNPTIRVSESFNETSTGVRLSWLLFDGFARDARIMAAKAGTAAMDAARRDMQRLMLQAVTIAFYQAQLAQEDRLISEQDRSFNKQLEQDADVRWKTGAAPEADKLTFSVRMLMAEARYLQADRDLTTAGIVLAELMGLPESKLPADYMPARNDTPLEESHVPSVEPELAFALKHRPDLISLDYQADALEQQVREKKGTWYPTIGLVAGADYIHRTELEPVQNNRDHYAGVVASWDLFTGGRRPAVVREAAAQLGALASQRIQKELEIQAAVRTSIETARVAYEIGVRQETAYRLSQRIRDFVEKGYKAGAETQTRLNEAQTDLTRTAGAAAQARVAYLLALANLDAETGRLLERVQE